ncbi:MAG: metallophosphoesterase family protein [Candidatus Odinarchaeia archaeon]
MLGQGDPFEIAKILYNSPKIVNPENIIVRFNDIFEMASIKDIPKTKWSHYTGKTEEELWSLIEKQVRKIENMGTAIFNFYPPPYGTLLDETIKTDENYKPLIRPKTCCLGHNEMYQTTHAGSKSVRKAIDEYQPLISLHGQMGGCSISINLGRTLAVNPGSEAKEGALKGILFELEKNKVKWFNRITG